MNLQQERGIDRELKMPETFWFRHQSNSFNTMLADVKLPSTKTPSIPVGHSTIGHHTWQPGQPQLQSWARWTVHSAAEDKRERKTEKEKRWGGWGECCWWESVVAVASVQCVEECDLSHCVGVCPPTPTPNTLQLTMTPLSAGRKTSNTADTHTHTRCLWDRFQWQHSVPGFSRIPFISLIYSHSIQITLISIHSKHSR